MIAFCIFVILYAIVLLNGFLPILETWQLGVLLLIPILYYCYQYSKSQKYIPTRKVCPNCGSTNVDFTFVASNAITAKGSSIDYTEIGNSKMAVCKDCGTSFRFVASNDIQTIRNSRRNIMILFIVAGLIIFAVIFWWRGAMLS